MLPMYKALKMLVYNRFASTSTLTRANASKRKIGIVRMFDSERKYIKELESLIIIAQLYGDVLF